MLKKLNTFLKDTSGATSVEYSLLIGFIGVTISTGAFLMGDEISTMFEGFSSYLDTRTIN